MNKKIKQHFQKADPLIFGLIEKIKNIEKLQTSENYFSDLCEIIINQQLSDKAASTIFVRFKKLFPKGNINATNLLNLSDSSIRRAGISWSKVTYLKDLAQKTKAKVIDLKHITLLTDEQMKKQLTLVKGIGNWSVEMFMMFSLGKEDIFSAGDLGLKKAIVKLYKLSKEPNEKELETISQKWSPFKTYACKLLWRSLGSEF